MRKKAYKYHGLRVTNTIPNRASIDSTLDDYEILGVKEIPMAEFESKTLYDLFYAANDISRSKKLADQIIENGWVDPIIVVKDSEGYYILEGVHRFGAFLVLGYETIPALVVLDLE